MFESRLFLKPLAIIGASVLGLSAFFYFATVPEVRSLVFDREEGAANTLLESFSCFIEESLQRLKDWETTLREERRQGQRRITEFLGASIQAAYDQLLASGTTREEAKAWILGALERMRFGNRRSFLWIADYDARLVFSSDEDRAANPFAPVQDADGNPLLPTLVEEARRMGSGYATYRRDGADRSAYSRNLSEQRWVIGADVRMEDIRQAVEARRERLVQTLGARIHATRFAGRGTLCLFEGTMQIIADPEGGDTECAQLLDRESRRFLGDRMIQAAAGPDKTLIYYWDTPEDRGHFVHKKIAWVRKIPSVDWYIALFVYDEDRKQVSEFLEKRILVFSIILLGLSLMGGYLFVVLFTKPLTRMATSTRRIGDDPLVSDAEFPEQGDELGLTPGGFTNATVLQLRDEIQQLEQRVRERTQVLSDQLSILRARNKEIESINTMGTLIQACRNTDEIMAVVIQTIRQLFPTSSGQILKFDPEAHSLEVIKHWGTLGKGRMGECFDAEDCWSLRTGKSYVVEDPEHAVICPHVDPDHSGRSAFQICIPMSTQGVVFGVFHVALDTPKNHLGYRKEGELHVRWIETVVEQASLSLANMRLRMKLEAQSTRDPLTGLYNRRYMADAIQQEVKRADRLGYSLGILLLDVDRFKITNDTWGHDAGDEALRRLAAILKRSFRARDVVCRYGGEEFLILLPEADLDASREKAERVRATVERELQFSWRDDRISVTISIGVSLYPWDGDSIQRAIERADQALYRAKEWGRNRVVTRVQYAQNAESDAGPESETGEERE